MRNGITFSDDDKVAYIHVAHKGENLTVKIDADDADLAEEVDGWGVFTDAQGKKLARSGKKSGQLFLHKLLVNVPPGHKLEWINGNTLDCRRSNLQLVDRDGNVTPLAKPQPTGIVTRPGVSGVGTVPMAVSVEKTSAVKGVTLHKASGRWECRPYIKGVGKVSLGYFPGTAEGKAAAEQRALEYIRENEKE